MILNLLLKGIQDHFKVLCLILYFCEVCFAFCVFCTSVSVFSAVGCNKVVINKYEMIL